MFLVLSALWTPVALAQEVPELRIMSTNYIGGGDYWEGEYYQLLIAAILGMTVMASARDLISIFIALETLSIPAYMLAGWRKRDLHGNEAGVKYYLLGVLAYGELSAFDRLAATHAAGALPSTSRVAASTGAPMTDMPYNRLGRSGLKVSALSFGSWVTFGTPLGANNLAAPASTYTITVDNLGLADVPNVVVTDTLPTGTTLVSSTGCLESPAGGAPTCTIASASGCWKMNM